MITPTIVVNLEASFAEFSASLKRASLAFETYGKRMANRFFKWKPAVKAYNRSIRNSPRPNCCGFTSYFGKVSTQNRKVNKHGRIGTDRRAHHNG